MQVLSHLDYDHYDDHYHLDDHIDYSFRLVDGGEGSLKVFKSQKYAYGRFYPASGTPSYGIRGWPATNETDSILFPLKKGSLRLELQVII